MPEISVVIPTYNRAKYLQQAIASVLKQTFQDFEIIVVDDASPSEYAPNIIRGFGDQRINYLRHPLNRGLSAARNTGIMASRGRYIAFLDDDDEWLPEKLALQYDMFMDSSPLVGIIYTGCVYLDKATNTIYEQIIPRKRGDLSKELMKYDCITAGCSSVLLRKESFERAGYFDENIPTWEAYDMWIRLSMIYHFDYVREPLVKYYDHDDKITMNYKKLISGIEIVLEKYKDYFSQARKWYSYHQFNLGVLYCLDRSMKEGRKLFLKSIRLYPLAIKYYFYLILSLMDAGTFRQCSGLREKLIMYIKQYRCILNEHS